LAYFSHQIVRQFAKSINFRQADEFFCKKQARNYIF